MTTSLAHEMLPPTSLDYTGVIDPARKRVEMSPLTSTAEGRLAETYAITAATILRPIIAASLRQKSVLTPLGGPGYNPHLKIDAMGGNIVTSLLQADDVPTSVFIEEQGTWRSTGTRNEAPRRLVLVDPVDETSGLIDNPPRYFQTTSMIITTPEGTIRAATIASLVDTRILLIEKDRVLFFDYDDSAGLVKRYRPKVPAWTQDGGLVRVAALPRRMEALKKLPLFTDPSIPMEIIPTFGGYGILDMFAPRGKPIDVMLDTTKGQPWYELWGAIAQKAGGIARGISGKDLSLDRLIQFAAIRHEPTKRIPVLIARDQKVYDFVAPKLNMYSRRTP